MKALFVFIISFLFSHFVLAAQYTLGWRTDAAPVYESGRGLQLESRYSEFEDGICALSAHAVKTDGKPSVVLTYSNSTSSLLPCTKEGNVFGVYHHCVYTTADKTFENGARCSRDLDASTVEYVSSSSLQKSLNLERHDKISKKQTQWTFNSTNRTIPVL